MKKTYSRDSVTFGLQPKFRKWEFTVGSFHYITHCPHGLVTATKVAGVIAGGVKRTKKDELDQLARANIWNLVNVAD